MGDEQDVFDLPLHQSESGSAEQGHLSALRQNILESQTTRLSETLESYYRGEITVQGLRGQLGELGYNEGRADQLTTSAHEEFVIRQQTRGQPSDLTPNQLVFLSAQEQLNYEGFSLHTDLAGRQYIDDYRVRELDGRPSRLYLPRPERFSPLTQDQREEIDFLTGAEQDIYLEPDADTGESQQLTEQQREEIMALATTYLNSDPDFRDAQRFQFRSNVQQISGLSAVDNIREDLLELFVDIDDEYNYRQNNNGLPRNMSPEQYQFLRRRGYVGQPILTLEEDNVLYYYSEEGKVPLPSDADIDRIREGVPEYTEFQIRPGNEEYNDMNLILADYMTGRSTFLETTRQIERVSDYNPRDPTRDPYRFVMYNEFILTLDIAQREKEFRDLNNGRPSELSELQYEYLQNHAISNDREERYFGQPIFVNNRGQLSYRMRDGVYLGIPSDEYIEGFIEQGLYTPPSQAPERANPSLDDPSLQDFRDQRIISAIGEDRFNNLNEEQIAELRRAVGRKGDLIRTYDNFNIDFIEPGQQVIFTDTERRERQPPVLPPQPPERPGLIPEAPPGLEPPIIPGQQTQPINLRTGEDLPVDTPQSNVLRYQQFFNDNQSLYYGFREIFRDILPVLSAGAGGYMTYLYKSSRSYNKLRTILSEETQLLSDLEHRIQSESDTLTQRLNELDQIREYVDPRAEELRQDIVRIGGRQDIIGGEQMRGMLLTNRRRELQSILNEVRQAQEVVSNLEEELVVSKVQTAEIRRNIELLQNKNYEILGELFEYSPKILVGIKVGYDLGLMLSGYLFPTYMNINEPYVFADNVDYDPEKETRNKDTERNINKPHDQPKSIPATIKEYQPMNRSRIVKPYKETFRPVKHGKRPLKYEELQELKSTLNSQELQNLKNKFIYFNEGELTIEKSEDKCKNVIQETIIPKRKLMK